jgi:hypothetical protein
VVTFGIVATCALATAVATKIALTPPASPEPIAEPPAPKPAAPVVIPIITPQPIVVQVPAPVPPPVEIAEALPPSPRAVIPVVRTECVTWSPDDSDEAMESCTWDSGFPAISADGTTLVTAEIPLDDGRGHPGLTIRFIDAATGKRVKSVLVLSPDEYTSPGQDDGMEANYRAMLKKVDRRATAVQKLLDAGRYRTLVRLGSSTSEPSAPANEGLAAEYEDDAVRVIDRATNTVLWQRRFSVAAEFPNRKLDGDHCEPIAVSNVAVAWDPPTRTAVAQVTYRHGPEFCGDSAREYVVQVPR